MTIRKLKECFFILTIIFVFLSTHSAFAYTVNDNTWPLWPVPGSYPYYEDGPLSFTYLNRDKFPYIEFVHPANIYETIFNEDQPLWWGQLGVPLWGSRMKIADMDIEQPVIAVIPSDSTRKIYFQKYTFDLNHSGITDSDVIVKLKELAVVPSYDPEFYTSGDIYIENQYFPKESPLPTIVKNWRDSLNDFPKQGEKMADSGHAFPYIVWPDNPWLLRFNNSYVEYKDVLSADYASNWGGAIAVLPTNDGLLHFFSTDTNNTDGVIEKYSFFPTPAFKLSIYQEFLANLVNVTDYPRLTLLDGNIAVSDIYVDNSWKRYIWGTTGEGVTLKHKLKAAWDTEGSPLPDAVSQILQPEEDHSAFGIYAIDITAADLPDEKWSVLGDGTHLFGTGEQSNPSSLYSNMKHVLTRPVVGYTGTVDNPNWHILISGIGRDNYYHLITANALTGVIDESKSLILDSIGNLETEGPDTGDYPSYYYRNNELMLPTRMQAALPKGATTPLLEEVYIHFANGYFYRWDISKATVDGENPLPMLRFAFDDGNVKDIGAAVTQDFDITWLRVGGELHRFLATPVQREKPGNIITGGGVRNLILVVDLTKVENYCNLNSVSYPYQITFETSYGTINELLEVKLQSDPANAVQRLYVASENQTQEGNILSAPIFFDGKIIFAATATEKDEGDKTAFYLVDPLSEETGDDPVVILPDASKSDKGFEIEGRGVGGAFVDADGTIYLPVENVDGTTTLVSQDLGDYVNPMGVSNINIETGPLYWEIK